MQQHDGQFPRQFEQILALPGIGRSTAAAICALAYHERHAILDGNVNRVLARYAAIEGYTGDKKIEASLWQQAEALLPQSDVAAYTQGLMDLGATLCTRSKPKCGECPVSSDCVAFQSGRVTQLPTPRPRKALPEKHSTFLVLHNGDILLEKRPPSGIWGGLWCTPQMDNIQDAEIYCVQHFGLETAQAYALPMFTHTFTHFKLHISPWCLQVQSERKQAEERGTVWLAMEDALRAAIPAPVRKILLDLR